MTNATVVRELQTIASSHGVLRAEDVVAAAGASNSPLHRFFTWDEGIAAHQYRLMEARYLIRSVVEYRQVVDQMPKMLEVFCSLSPDRQMRGGGYRSMVTILENRTMRDQRLADLIAELQRIQCKCSEFQELRRIYEAINDVVEKHPPKSVRPSRKSAQAIAT